MYKFVFYVKLTGIYRGISARRESPGCSTRFGPIGQIWRNRLLSAGPPSKTVSSLKRRNIGVVVVLWRVFMYRGRRRRPLDPSFPFQRLVLDCDGPFRGLLPAIWFVWWPVVSSNGRQNALATESAEGNALYRQSSATIRRPWYFLQLNLIKFEY